MAAEKPSSKRQAWFCTTGLPSDVVIEIDEMSFHLHKFPLMSRSKKLHQLITEQEQDPGGPSRRGREVKGVAATPLAGSEEKGPDGEEVVEGGDGVEEEMAEMGQEEIEEVEPYHITLADFPGAADAFEAAAKFCYGAKLELTPWNVAPLRCAAEYLEMTEEFCEDNLISRCERFLGQTILRSLRDSARALKSCEDLMPLAEALGIPQRCVDAIAVRASSIDPSSSLFGWPMNERTGGVGASDRRVLANHPVLWNGIDTGLRRKHRGGASNRSTATADGGGSTWFDDLTILGLPLFRRSISAMKARGLSPEAIEGCLISYAKRSIPGLSRSSRKGSGGAPLPSEADQRELLETVIADLPLEKTAATSTRFLFGLLRTVNILRASESSREILERKVASQLDRASLDDLLMPSYSYLVETLYDVDCVERILGYFLEGLQDAAPAISAAEEDDDDNVEGGAGGRARSPPSLRPLMMVGKLVDGYLSEIASDANLEPDKFCDLALALPDHARVYDDGLYRAVDVYLKAHPRISELERERVCSVMDYQKLTLEACTHAAQNERLPLRAIVQVLFFEQLQLRHAIAGSLLAADLTGGSQPPESARGGPRFHDESLAQPVAAVVPPREGETWRSAVRDNQVLRLDMDSMRNRVNELERECSSMKKVLEKMDRVSGVRLRGEVAGGDAKGWNSFTRKFGCKFKTQVCDSHERTVLESRRNRAELAMEQPPQQLQLHLQLEQSM